MKTTGSSPPTPEGFIIRTPSPKIAASMQLLNTPPPILQRFALHNIPPIFTTSTSLSALNVHPPMNISPVLLDCLPFRRFNSAFGNKGT
jgi:hypothetical protein